MLTDLITSICILLSGCDQVIAVWGAVDLKQVLSGFDCLSLVHNTRFADGQLGEKPLHWMTKHLFGVFEADISLWVVVNVLPFLLIIGKPDHQLGITVIP
ncbi:MAG: hypothetical protein JXB03_04225 [Spirochaetales bacterium]|nr:hypothetical protein [Spirochaetales bacterium]